MVTIDSPSSTSFRAAAACLLQFWRRPYRRFAVAERSFHGEEMLLLATLMSTVAGGRRGHFVELGAYDGLCGSNTLLLERCLEWSGVLIEANPANFASLKANAKQRQRSAVVHSAICALNGTASTGTVRMSVGKGATMAQLDATSRHHMATWKIDPQQNGVAVACRPLASIMRESLPAPHRANFLSLDVEGAEAAVLETVDPSAFDVIMRLADKGITMRL